MANNRETTRGLGNQVVYSEPQRMFVGTYLTKKGLFLMKSATKKADIDEICAKYEKNRYIKNPNAYPIKVIMHNE